MTWTLEIFRTIDGAAQSPTLEPSAASWATGLKGTGRAQHTVPLFSAGIDPDVIRELSTGNKYMVVQRWSGNPHVTYAGVIQEHDWDVDSQTLTISSGELRLAYMNDRMLYSVHSYDPDGVVLAVTNKSHSGAVRAVNALALQDWFWLLPLDDTADGSGTFSASWRHDERLKWEDHLKQIEDDGCEIYFPPYVDVGGSLRFKTIVATTITSGTATALSVSTPANPVADSPVVNLRQRTNYVREMTGILGFGKGGTASTPYGYSPGDGAAVLSVRDVWINFPDTDEDRLPAAVEALDELGYPITQWSFGLQVFPDGPAYVAPGRLLDMTIAGDLFIADDTYSMRVIALRGNLSGRVEVEVQLA